MRILWDGIEIVLGQYRDIIGKVWNAVMAICGIW